MTHSNIFRFTHLRIIGGGYYELWGCPTSHIDLICDRLNQLSAKSIKSKGNGVIRFQCKQAIAYDIASKLTTCPIASPIRSVKILPSGTKLIAA